MAELPHRLGLPPFRPRFPWWGGDLQTLRDSLHPPHLPADQASRVEVDIGGGDRLLALLDRPIRQRPEEPFPIALVLVLHGLGGSSQGGGLRRLGVCLQAAGFAVLRLNLRGAGPGRGLARGSYAALCNQDLWPALLRARSLGASLAPSGGNLPLFGVGSSLGGTVLLNAILASAGDRSISGPWLDGLACVSSPLELASCSAWIGRLRNLPYQAWLVRRLIRETLADPFGSAAAEGSLLREPGRIATIRAFDAAITAPRWGFASVEEYYEVASPLQRLRAAPCPAPTLLVHADDDPWVPVGPTRQLGGMGVPNLEVVITRGGGHNGFHGRGEVRVGAPPSRCWADQLVVRWLTTQATGKTAFDAGSTPRSAPHRSDDPGRCARSAPG